MRLILTFLLLFCASAIAAPATKPADDDMVLIKRGTFKMGTADGFPFEGPVHDVLAHVTGVCADVLIEMGLH